MNEWLGYLKNILNIDLYFAFRCKDVDKIGRYLYLIWINQLFPAQLIASYGLYFVLLDIFLKLKKTVRFLIKFVSVAFASYFFIFIYVVLDLIYFSSLSIIVLFCFIIA